MFLALAGWLSSLRAEAGGNAALPPTLTGLPPMQVWQTEDEGASNINWGVVVHPTTGFVYVANQTGLLEFDGVRWRLMPLPRGGPVRSVAVATDGRVWVAGTAQICVLEPGPLGELRLVDVGAQLPENPPPVVDAPAADPAAREEDADAAAPDPRLIGATPNMISAPDGMYFVLPRRIVRFRPGGGLDIWRKPAETTALGWWSDGALHVVMAGGGIQRLEPDGLKPVMPRGGPRVLDSVPEADGGWLWLAVTGPIRVVNNQRRLLASPEVTALFQTDRPRCALALPGGGGAYGTMNHGLVVLDATGRLVQIIDRGRGLPANRVNGIAADAEGGLWLAMHAGLVRLQLDSPLRLHGLAQGLSGNPRQVGRVGPRLYVTHSEGVVWRDDATGQFHDVPGITAATQQLAVSGDEALVAGLGLFALRPDGPALALGNAMYRQGVAYARSRPDLIFVYGPLDVQFWQCQSADPGAPRWSVGGTFANIPTGADDLYDDGHGYLWLVTRDLRVRRVDLRGGVRADAPAMIFGAEQGLPEFSRPGAVRLLPTGDELIVTNRRGNWRFDAAVGRFLPDARLAPGPTAVLSTAGGAWLYYPRPQPHLARVEVGADGGWKTTAYPLPELGNLPVHGLHADAPSHTLWIAAEGQLLSFDWDAVSARPPTPLRATLRRVLTLGGQPLWQHPPSASDGEPPLVLAADQRAVRVEFTAAAYQTDVRVHPPLRFRTRAPGIDAGWSGWSDAAYRDLTNLPDGAFAFEVQATDLVGRESAVQRLAFSVRPPWWRTSAARAGWIVLAGGAFVGAMAWRTRALRRRAAHLETVVAARTEELRVQNLELARLHRLEMDEKIAARLAEEKAQLERLRYQLNPHFLLNAFTTLRSLVFSSPAAAGEMVSRLASFCRLALTRSDEAGVTVTEEVQLVETYLSTEQARWRDSLKWRIEVDPTVSARRLPPFLLQPLVENAVKYGGRTSPDVLEVHVRIEDSGTDGLRIEVANTGAWMEPGTAPDSTGLGLENLRQRLRRYYRDAHRFDIQHADGWVRILLHLRGDPV